MNSDNVWRELVHDPQKNPLGVIPEVMLTNPRSYAALERQIATSENCVRHVHQRSVEPLLGTLGVALAVVVQVGRRKVRMALYSPNGWSPLLLPVLGNPQDVLHEYLYVDENPVGLEILSDILFVLGAIVFLSFVGIGAQLLQDCCPLGEWG